MATHSKAKGPSPLKPQRARTQADNADQNGEGARSVTPEAFISGYEERTSDSSAGDAAADVASIGGRPLSSVPGYDGHPRVKKGSSLRISEPLHQQFTHVASKTGYRSAHELLVHLVEREVEARLMEEGYTSEEIRKAREATAS